MSKNYNVDIWNSMYKWKKMDHAVYTMSENRQKIKIHLLHGRSEITQVQRSLRLLLNIELNEFKMKKQKYNNE